MSEKTAELIMTSYAQAPARTITVGETTYAYRELGPKGVRNRAPSGRLSR